MSEQLFVENAIFCNADLFDNETHRASCKFLQEAQVMLANNGFVEQPTVQFKTHAYTEFDKGACKISISTYVGARSMIVLSVLSTDSSLPSNAVNELAVWKSEKTVQGEVANADFADYQNKLSGILADMTDCAERFGKAPDSAVPSDVAQNIPVTASQGTEFLQADERLRKWHPVLSKHDLPVMTQFVYRGEDMNLANSLVISKDTRFAIDMVPESDKYFVAVSGHKPMIIVSAAEATKLVNAAQQVI